MFSPVSVSGTGYPQLTASTGTPYGQALAPPSQAIENRGGPTFGLNSLSEPNTSPDVITIAGKLYEECDVANANPRPGTSADWIPKANHPKLITKRTHIRGGTPIAVYTDDGKTRDGEPLHRVSVINDKFKARAAIPGSRDAKELKIKFMTVTVGDFWFEPHKITYLAIAVQNVATVDFEGTSFETSGELYKLALGDRFYLTTKMDGTVAALPNEMYPFCRFEKHLTATSCYQRVLTLVAPPIGKTARCDIGPFISHAL